MSRHEATLGDDDNCVIGFDPDRETLFFQSGDEDDEGRPTIWLGHSRREFLSAAELVREVSLRSGKPFEPGDGLVGKLREEIRRHVTSSYTGRELRDLVKAIPELRLAGASK